MSRKQRIAYPLWEKYKVVLVATVLGLLTIVTFAGIRNADFTNYDDNSYVTNNRVIRNGITWEGIEYAFFPEKNFWHPLTWLSHMVDCELYGPNPTGHHLTNLVLHVGGVVLLFFALRVMTGTLWRSALVAALYALHPLHVESVAWIAERKGVLSSFFWMLTLVFYAFYARRPHIGWYAGVFLAVVCSLSSKPNTITLPFALLLLDVWPLRRLLLRSDGDMRSGLGLVLGEKLPLFAVTAWFGILAAEYQKSAGAFDLLRVSLYGRVANALTSPCIYLRRFVWPSDLAVHYPHPGDSIPVWQPVAAAAIYLLVAVVGLVQLRRRPYLLVGWLWYLGTLVPVSGIVQIGIHGMADRYTDIPLIGIYLIVAWGLAEVAARSSGARFFVCSLSTAALLAFAFVSTVQTMYWKDATVLFRRALAVTKNSKLAHQNYAFMMMEREKNPSEALYHFREMVKIAPEDPYAHDILGNALYVYGQRDQAFAEFQKAVELKPDLVSALTNLGAMQIERGSEEEGLARLRQAIAIDPDYAHAHRSLGNYLLSKEDWDGAIREFQICMELEPTREHQQFLALALQRKQSATTSGPATDPPP